MPQMRKCGKFIFGKSLIRDGGTIQFPEQAIREYDIASEQYLKLKKDMKLLSIRSSDIAFTMGAYGPLLEESFKHDNEIKVY